MTVENMLYLKRTMQRQKNIYLLTNASRSSGRGILQGFISATRWKSNIRPHICEMSDFGLRHLAEDILNGNVDGLITSELETPGFANLLERSKIPLVVIGTRRCCLPKRDKNLRIVTTDERKLGAFAAKHLITLGHFAAYGYVNPREHLYRYLSSLREKGFLDVIRQNGLVGTSFRNDRSDDEPDKDALSAWIQALPKPAAIQACGDVRAAEILDIASRLDIRVPEDIRVLGIGNDEILCQQTRPTLSSVSTDNECEGRTAVQQLLSLLHKGKVKAIHKPILCSTHMEVFERESTTTLAPGLILTKRAQDFITANADRDLTVSEVIGHLGVSRRLAYLRFREFAHMSIQQAITKARISHVKHRLACSRQTIDTISRSCGFSNPNTLKIIFKRETGMTMRDWRSQNVRVNDTGGCDELHGRVKRLVNQTF